MITKDRRSQRDIRHHRLRRYVRGSAGRPRLAVFRSLNHIYAQLIDDDAGTTLLTVTSRSADFRGRPPAPEATGAEAERAEAGRNGGRPAGGNVAAAKIVGELLAQKAKERGIERVVFDRGGYKYHGRVKALADAARAGGLVF